MITKLDFIKESFEKTSLDMGQISDVSQKVYLDTDFSSSFDSSGLDDILHKLDFNEARVGRLGERLFKAESIYDYNLSLHGEPCSAGDYVASYVKAAQLKGQELLLNESRLSGMNLRSISNPDNKNFRRILVANKVRSWLVAIGIFPQMDYDVIHSLSAYNFTHKKAPNLFAQNTASYINGTPDSPSRIIQGKDVLSLGPGNAIDEKFFIENGVNKVSLIESSPYAMSLIDETRNSIDPLLRNKLILPDGATDIFSGLSRCQEDGVKFDSIYSHSVLHYFDNTSLKKLFFMSLGCLNKGGYFSFAIKAPGAILDGNGICLINDTESIKTRRGGREVVHLSGWLNNDTQIRFFRDRDEIINLISEVENEGVFEVRSDERFSIENYDTEGNQVFYRFHFKKV